MDLFAKSVAFFHELCPHPICVGKSSGEKCPSWINTSDSLANSITDFINAIFNRKKIKIVHKKKPSTNSFNKTKKTSTDSSRQEKVDAILDKIKASGYDSLSKEEKDYLFDASKNI